MELLIPVSLIDNFHFLRPLWLLALIPVLLFLIAMWRVNSVVSAWDKAIDKTLLPYLLDRSKNTSQRTPLILLLVTWTLSILALAGPVWEQLPQPVQKKEDALVIVLDLSLSMFAPDHAPTRLDLAKRKLRDILAPREEGQTALIVYAGDAHAVTPLTDDVVTIESLVPSLSQNIMPLFGSNPVAAIDLAVELFEKTDSGRGKILLMTDGISGSNEELQITEQITNNGHELLIMGIGTEEGAPIRTNDGNFLTDEAGNIVIPKLNKTLLRSLANRVNGRYHDIQLADTDLDDLLADSTLLDEDQISELEEQFDIWHEVGPWLLLLVLPIAALSFRRGWLLSLIWIAGANIMRPSQQAQALEWKDLWQTKDQQAAAAFANEDHTTAALLFESSDWAGAASYKAENYEAATALFETIDTADGHYNRGNALALSGKYPEAIAAYDKALSIEAEHADAIKNKKIIEELQESKEAKNSQEKENEEEQQQSGDTPENSSEEDSENNEQREQEEEANNENQDDGEQDQEELKEQDDFFDADKQQNSPNDTTNADFEEQQSLEQWLRRIEDDPGELLRRKFRHQYRQRQLNGTANNSQNGGQIW